MDYMNIYRTATRAALLCAFAASLMAQDLTGEPIEGRGGALANFERIAPEKTKTGNREAMYTVGDTPPVLANFYWGNQGACTVATNPDGSVTMFHPGAAGLGFNWCMIVQPLPAPPYTVIVRTQGHILGKAASLGLVLFDMTNGKFIAYSTPGASDSGAAAVAAWRMNNFTTYPGSPAGIVYNYTNAMATGGLQAGNYTRLKDNGTTRTVAISATKGGPWLTISATANTDHMAGQWFGYTLRGTGDNMASMMTVYHEEITTP